MYFLSQQKAAGERDYEGFIGSAFWFCCYKSTELPNSFSCYKSEELPNSLLSFYLCFRLYSDYKFVLSYS